MTKQSIFSTIYAVLATGSLLIPASITYAQSDEEKGLAIATEADTRANGFMDTRSEMTMVLRNKAGKESVRKMRARVLEVAGDGDKSLTIFDEPKDVKGTASLTFSHAVKADEQWLYLPALKRVKRISSKNKSGPFMGSEFAFEDISSQELEKYSYKYLRDEDIEGRTTFVVESVPQYKNSGYKRIINWIDAEEYYSLQTEFYDRKNTLLKTLTFSDHKLYLDKFWRAHKLQMINHQNGKSTTLTWNDFEFQTGLTDADFNSKSLKRIR